jgi:hypothetical protein
MKELLRTNDPVERSFIMALLRDAGFNPVELDQHMSVMEGSASAIQCRIAVPEHEWADARS